MNETRKKITSLPHPAVGGTLCTKEDTYVISVGHEDFKFDWCSWVGDVGPHLKVDGVALPDRRS